jgi:hypothetical protein
VEKTGKEGSRHGRKAYAGWFFLEPRVDAEEGLDFV